MPTNSLSSVVDALVAELAEHRRMVLRRHAAYLKLARAIVADDESDEGFQAYTARLGDGTPSSMQA